MVSIGKKATKLFVALHESNGIDLYQIKPDKIKKVLSDLSEVKAEFTKKKFGLLEKPDERKLDFAYLEFSDNTEPVVLLVEERTNRAVLEITNQEQVEVYKNLYEAIKEESDILVKKVNKINL